MTTSPQPARCLAVGIGVLVATVLAAACVSPGPAPPSVVTDSVVVDGQIVTVAVPAGLTVSVDRADPAEFPLVAADFDFGALDIDIDGLAPGSTVQVSVTLPSRVDTVRKLIAGAWVPFPFDGTTGARISADGRTVTVDLRDGGRGDLDGVANGVVVDPLALGSDVGAVPTMTFGEPFSHQLEATGGVGSVVWSVVGGWLPPGITLDPSGLLSGTPTGNGGWVRVQASDGTTTATRLLVLSVLSPTALSGAGAALPEGSNLRVAFTQVNPPRTSWVGDFGPTGNLTRLATASIATAPGLGITGPFASSLNPAFPNPAVSPDGDVAVFGDLVMDAETGATIATLGLSQPVSWNGTWFSPDGGFVAVSDATAGLLRIFETTGWTEVRAVASVSGSSGIIWSPDSTELIVNQPTIDPVNGIPGPVQVVSTTAPAGDRFVTVSPVLDLGGTNPVPLQCRNVLDWSVTGRLALSCGPAGVSIYRSAVTASAADGSDVRIVAPVEIGSSSSSIPLRIYGWTGGARFSPSGTRLAVDAFECASGSLGTGPCTTRLVVAADAPSSLLTPLTSPLPTTSGITLPLSWTGVGPALDGEPPVLVLPEPIVRAAETDAGASVSWVATASDDVDGVVPVTCTPGPGLFAVGVTVVSCVAADNSGNQASGSFSVTVEPPLDTLDGVSALAAGYDHSCAIVDGGSVWCWGANASGQLGNGTTANARFATQVPGLAGVTALSAGSEHTCALAGDGTVQCWGSNASGQLGTGTTTDSTVPVSIPGLIGATALAAAQDHTCAVIIDGSARCWGSNSSGQLGNGTTTDSSVPVTVSGLSGVTSISAGQRHTCAALLDGRAFCWGSNVSGQLGDGTTTDSSVPAAVSGVSDATDIAAGAGHSCVVVGVESVVCWGSNELGQLGDGTTNSSAVPVEVLDLVQPTAVSSGWQHTCALVDGGFERCWGSNGWSQLGLSSPEIPYSETPVPATDFGFLGGIVTGRSHTCVETGAQAYCLGSNAAGQLATAFLDPVQSSPSPVQRFG